MEAPSRPPPSQQSSAKNIRNGPIGSGPMWILTSRANPTEGTAGRKPSKAPPTPPTTRPPPARVLLTGNFKAKPNEGPPARRLRDRLVLWPALFQNAPQPRAFHPRRRATPYRRRLRSSPPFSSPLPLSPRVRPSPDVPRNASNLPNRSSIPFSQTSPFRPKDAEGGFPPPDINATTI